MADAAWENSTEVQPMSGPAYTVRVVYQCQPLLVTLPSKLYTQFFSGVCPHGVPVVHRVGELKAGCVWGGVRVRVCVHMSRGHE